MSEQVEMEEEDRRVSSATKEQSGDKKRFEVKKVNLIKVDYFEPYLKIYLSYFIIKLVECSCVVGLG